MPCKKPSVLPPEHLGEGSRAGWEGILVSHHVGDLVHQVVDGHLGQLARQKQADALGHDEVLVDRLRLLHTGHAVTCSRPYEAAVLPNLQQKGDLSQPAGSL